MGPRIFILILNWNGSHDTAACLQSIQDISYPNFQAVVIDNGSTDGSVERIRERFPAVTILRNETNLGFAEGNNTGIRYALNNGADFIFLLNNDTVVDKDILAQLVEAAAHKPDAGIFGAKIYYYAAPEKIWFAGGVWDEKKKGFVHRGQGRTDSADYSSICETDYATGCALFFRRDVAERIGLLDPRFFLIFEETDWCYRARRAGFSVIFVPQARVWHKVSVSFGGNASALYHYYYTRNRLLWARLNLTAGTRYAVYARVFLEAFFPECVTSRHTAWKRRIHSDITRLMRIRADNGLKAALRGMADFLLRRYGECPPGIYALHSSNRK